MQAVTDRLGKKRNRELVCCNRQGVMRARQPGRSKRSDDRQSAMLNGARKRSKNLGVGEWADAYQCETDIEDMVGTTVPAERRREEHVGC